MSENGTWRVDESGYSLVVSFPDQSPSFVHGFEAGKIWNRMRSGAEAKIEQITHVENREVLLRMAIAEGWSIERVPSSTIGWDTTVLRKVKTVSPNPHGLRVVAGSDHPDKD